MHLNARNVGAVGEDKQVTLGGVCRSTCQCGSNLDDGIARQRNNAIECSSQELLHFLLAVAPHFQHSIKRIGCFRKLHMHSFASHSLFVGRVDRCHTLCKGLGRIQIGGTHTVRNKCNDIG